MDTNELVCCCELAAFRPRLPPKPFTWEMAFNVFAAVSGARVKILQLILRPVASIARAFRFGFLKNAWQADAAEWYLFQTPETTVAWVTYAAVSYAANEIWESAFSGVQKMRGRAWAE